MDSAWQMQKFTFALLLGSHTQVLMAPEVWNATLCKLKYRSAIKNALYVFIYIHTSLKTAHRAAPCKVFASLPQGISVRLIRN